MSGDSDGFRFSGVDDLFQPRYCSFFPSWVHTGFNMARSRLIPFKGSHVTQFGLPTAIVGMRVKHEAWETVQRWCSGCALDRFCERCESSKGRVGFVNWEIARCKAGRSWFLLTPVKCLVSQSCGRQEAKQGSSLLVLWCGNPSYHDPN